MGRSQHMGVGAGVSRLWVCTGRAVSVQGPAVPAQGVCEEHSLCVCVCGEGSVRAAQNHRWCLYTMESVCAYRQTRRTVCTGRCV